ncbi:response regulator [Paenibacillus vietnamensis]|uniref:response regulator n=1 Tax=Paenibacillus vietnamensis TaxID=2590547 RepID=UPI001CD05536|nr:response regulator [Paenibacillus vietnamensis]
MAGEAEDGVGALELIQRVRPDIVMADIQMPQMDGITLLAELERLDISTRVIIISAYRDFEYAQKAVKYGAYDYLLKPIYEDQLLEVVSRCIADITRESRQLTEWNKMAEYMKEGLPLARRKYLESLTIGKGYDFLFLPALLKQPIAKHGFSRTRAATFCVRIVIRKCSTR